MRTPAGAGPADDRPRRRYARAGRVYDVLSLERLLYGGPRHDLMTMLGALPGATVVDVGCGTGLNFPGLQRIIGPGGRIVGIDTSDSMLAAARRRVRAAGWTNVVLLQASARDLPATLASAGVALDAVDAIVATFVVSILGRPSDFWSVVDRVATERPVRVAVADLGDAVRTGPVRRGALRLLTAVGGADLDARPWTDLASRATDHVHVSMRGGHVHLAVGNRPPVHARSVTRSSPVATSSAW